MLVLLFFPPLQIGFSWYVLFVIKGKQWQEVVVRIVIPRAPLPVSFATLDRLLCLSERVPSGGEGTAPGTRTAAAGLCCGPCGQTLCGVCAMPLLSARQTRGSQ